ncbi:Smr/MutS family protein [Patescibacteria group bacterium]|nr:Smr/MutS family protein [Patescibacteria group bacterium]
MSQAVLEINIKFDMPDVKEARKRLRDELDKARQKGIVAVKIIHGYGSKGVGGALRDALRRSLTNLKNKKQIRHFVHGERFAFYELVAREATDMCPALKSDPDYNRNNEGITIVIL